MSAALMLNGIGDTVANLGFPIGAFLLMYQLVTRTIKENTLAIKELVIEIKTRK